MELSIVHQHQIILSTHNLAQNLTETGYEIHHTQPLKGHPGIPGLKSGEPTLFPTGGLPVHLNSHTLNLQKVPHSGHYKLHYRLYKQEKFWEINHSPIITSLKVELLGLNQCDCK